MVIIPRIHVEEAKMPTIIENGIEYCLELSPDEDDGDNTNKPSTDIVDEAVVSHCK